MLAIRSSSQEWGVGGFLLNFIVVKVFTPTTPLFWLFNRKESMKGNIMGMRIALKGNRRCDYCKRPRKTGYLVKQGQTQGFFCGRMCFEGAKTHMKAEKEKMGVK